VLATLSRWRPRVQIPHSAPHAIVAERLQAPAFQAGDEGSSPSDGSRIIPCPFRSPEVVRLVEDTVSKTAGGRKASRGFESLRLRTMTLGVRPLAGLRRQALMRNLRRMALSETPRALPTARMELVRTMARRSGSSGHVIFSGRPGCLTSQRLHPEHRLAVARFGWVQWKQDTRVPVLPA
jgi:hypothetical protein